MNCTQMSYGRLLFVSILFMSFLDMCLARVGASSEVRPTQRARQVFLFQDTV